ncbi:acyl-CoA dehydrogenase NM domain-like protein [Favolaschia claudopus]|uniref:Acyl-CoA dehydrogenase NM domain-like protein n=1 Tax=Favolaschia claudopus TaxID=2862362 RepID=A0AAW0E0A2_9AGAR
MRVEDIFRQQPPPPESPFLADPVLPSLLKRILPDNVFNAVVKPDLTRLGDDLVNVVRPLTAQVRPATLTNYNGWGERIDHLETSEGWKALTKLAIQEGYISTAYDRESFREHARVYMFAKCMIMTGDFHVIMCPFGMTDGAARLVELFGTDKMKAEVFPRLISRDPAEAFISGQWMTESPGGSDVSRTETTATPTPPLPTDLGPSYLLDGFKWFSSAAEGNLSVALARTGDAASGSRALSLFMVPIRFQPFPTPLSNNIQVHRLKDKIGTHGVPTAELSLNSARAWLIGGHNEGIKTITPMLNITRIHSAIHSIGSLQRCLSIARSYATVRTVAGGKLLQSIPSHMENLANTTILYAALAHLTFGAVILLGKNECGIANKEETARLRLLTPTAKGFAALKAVTAMEECMTALGGQGYIEETGFGRLIRDALVEKIWEGTVDIMALDLIRAARDNLAIQSFCQWALAILSRASVKSKQILELQSAIERLPSIFQNSANPLLPRSLLILFGHIASSVYLLEHAIWAQANGESTAIVDLDRFQRWVEEGSLKAALFAVSEILGAKVQDRVTLNGIHVYSLAKL